MVRRALQPAVIAATVGVAAVAMALSTRAGIDDALAEPARAGEVWDQLVYTPDNRARNAFFRRDPDVAAAERIKSYYGSLAGRPLRFYVATPVAEPLDFVVTDGRLPQRRDEVALGTATLDDIGAAVGDRVAGGPKGDRAYEIVGEAFFPNLSGREAYDEGAWLTPAGLRRIEPDFPDFNEYFVTFRDGADPEAFASRVADAGLGLDEFQAVAPATRLNLRHVRNLPLLLVAVFALLGAGAVAHALVTTVRRRRRDLAVLRAVGMSCGQARCVVAAQATTLAGIAVLLGVPLGVLGGRLAWRWVADSMPLVYLAPRALVTIGLAAVAGVALTNLIAFLPARFAVRQPPAAALRAE
jgi:hypothetical protein